MTVYARFEDTSPEEFRRVIEINYLGQVHGALAASPRLRRNGGGALISVSLVEGSVSLPLTSAYAASKHAVEGALDALRRELLAENVPISFDLFELQFSSRIRDLGAQRLYRLGPVDTYPH